MTGRSYCGLRHARRSPRRPPDGRPATSGRSSAACRVTVSSTTCRLGSALAAVRISLATPGRDLAQLGSGLPAELDGALLGRGRGVEGIDVAGAALQVEAERLAAQGLFHHGGRHAREVRGIEPVVGAVDDGMAGVVDQDRERVPPLSSMRRTATVGSMGAWAVGPVLVEPGHAAVALDAQAVVADEGRAVADAEPDGDRAAAASWTAAATFATARRFPRAHRRRRARIELGPEWVWTASTRRLDTTRGSPP